MSDDDGQTRILVVEDSAPTRQLIEMCLERREYDITTCGDGATGLETALNNEFDLLILDIALPRMDGWEVLHRIRLDQQRAKLPVLVVTAHHDTVVTKQSPEAQSVDGFLAKPFDINDLEEAVVSVIARAGHSSAPGAST